MSKTPLYWNKAKKYLSQKDKTMSSLIKKYKSPSETVHREKKTSFLDVRTVSEGDLYFLIKEDMVLSF